MPVFKTAFQGCSVKFSPFYEHRLAVATTKNFGKNGNGCLHILDLSPTPSSPTPISELTFFDTAEGINDVSWSKSDNNLLVAAFADGSLKLYDTSLPPQQNPCRSFVRHSDEAYSVDWSPKRSNSFISGSFDHTINLWTVDNPTRVRTFKGHDYCVYSVAWNPLLDNVFASASGDYTVRCWDVRNPRSTMTILGNEHEILSCDWNMYDDYLLATGAVDNMVRVWDVRSIRTPIAVLSGHEYAVMKVKFSPHRRNMVMSFSLDYTVCMWDFTVEDALIEKYDLHTDSPGGIDMSFFDEGLLASTAWDGMTYVWQRGTDPRAEGDSMDPQLEMLCGSIMKLEVENKNDTPHTSPVAEPPLCTVGHLTQEKEKKKKKKKKGPLNIKHCIK